MPKIPINKQQKKQQKLLKEVFDVWMRWKGRCKELLGYDNETKCFEFAIVEALNIPEGSLK